MASVQVLESAKRPMIVVGSSCLQRGDGAAVQSAVSTLASRLRTTSGVDADWRVLNVLQRVRDVGVTACVVSGVFFFSSFCCCREGGTERVRERSCVCMCMCVCVCVLLCACMKFYHESGVCIYFMCLHEILS